MTRSTLKTFILCLQVISGFVLISLTCHQTLAKEKSTSSLSPGRVETALLTDATIRADMTKYIGVPYRKAGASKRGFDCSGFVKVIYKEIFGIALPHQSSEQSLSSELVVTSLDSLRTGDLIFFSISSKKRAINHVGIYLSDRKFIHASRSKGVIVSELTSPYWRSKIVSAKRPVRRDKMMAEDTNPETALFLDRQENGFLQYEKRNFSIFSKSFLETPSVRSFAGEKPQRREFDYETAIHPSLISHFTVFRESLSLMDKESYSADRPILGAHTLYKREKTYAQGLRVAGDIKPLAGFLVTPSLSYLDYGPSLSSAALPKLVAALHVGLFSSSGGWSLSTDLRLPLSTYPDPFLNDNEDENILDISLTYRQRLSERVHLSLRGDNFLGFAPRLRDSHSPPSTTDQKLTLMLHFFY